MARGALLTQAVEAEVCEFLAATADLKTADKYHLERSWPSIVRISARDILAIDGLEPDLKLVDRPRYTNGSAD